MFCHFAAHYCPYYSSSAPPTQRKAYQALLMQEVNNKLASLESICGFTQLINDALHLEHDQYVVVQTFHLKVITNRLCN